MAEQTMVERVALAIQGPLGISTADALFAAKRAIEAMREPSEKMLFAGIIAERKRNLETKAWNIWTAMIGAAQAEERHEASPPKG